MKDSDLHSLRFVVGQLRHAYHNMITGQLKPEHAKEFANGLIACQISSIERIIKNEEKARSSVSTPTGEGEECGAERVYRLKVEWSKRADLSEGDHAWLLTMASRAIRAEAALPKGLPDLAHPQQGGKRDGLTVSTGPYVADEHGTPITGLSWCAAQPHEKKTSHCPACGVGPLEACRGRVPQDDEAKS